MSLFYDLDRRLLMVQIWGVGGHNVAKNTIRVWGWVTLNMPDTLGKANITFLRAVLDGVCAYIPQHLWNFLVGELKNGTKF